VVAGNPLKGVEALEYRLRAIQRKNTIAPPTRGRILSSGSPKALSNAPTVLEKCFLGPNGPRIRVKAVQDIVVSIVRGEGST
jgi:hypothetical protein